MIKVAILDDYQNAFKEIVDVKNLKINLILKFLMKRSMMKMKLLGLRGI